MNIKKIDLFILSINILFFIYYSFQLLVFTDEFALRNIGSFNPVSYTHLRAHET